MACRHEEDDAARRRAVNLIVEGNIRRVLPHSVKISLEERITNRKRMGLPPFTVREIEQEAIELEKLRNERRVDGARPVAPPPGRFQRFNRFERKDRPDQGRPAQAVHIEVNNAADLGEWEDTTSGEEYGSESENEEMNLLISEIQHQKEKQLRKGRPFEPQNAVKGAIKRFNRRIDPNPQRQQPPRNQKAVAQVMGAPYYPQGQPYVPVRAPPMGPPPRLVGPPEEVGGLPFTPIHELLKMANVEKGHCIQCGIPGHLMSKDECALKGKPLVDRACAKCGHGLHNANDCPRVYQPQFKQANLIEHKETLNENQAD